MSGGSITGRVVATERRASSYYGNPAFLVTIETPAGDRVKLKTMSNASICYAINNPEYRDELHTFELTRAGNIRTARRA